MDTEGLKAVQEEGFDDISAQDKAEASAEKMARKHVGKRVAAIVLALAVGAGATLFAYRPDLWNSFRGAAIAAFSPDKPARAETLSAVTTSALNVRSGQGADSSVVATLEKGASVELPSGWPAGGEWVQIRTAGGVTGWCMRQYLSLGGQAAAASETPSQAASSSETQSSSQISMAVAAAQVSLEQAKKPLSISVSIAEQRVTVYDAEGRIVKQFVCSTGTKGSETPTGTFRIAERGKSFYSESANEGGYYWTQFKGNYLFHSVPFDKNYHMEPEEAAKLGTPASHGCVRLAMENAKWIYDNVSRGTSVTIR